MKHITKYPPVWWHMHSILILCVLSIIENPPWRHSMPLALTQQLKRGISASYKLYMSIEGQLRLAESPAKVAIWVTQRKNSRILTLLRFSNFKVAVNNEKRSKVEIGEFFSWVNYIAKLNWRRSDPWLSFDRCIRPVRLIRRASRWEIWAMEYVTPSWAASHIAMQ